ncbi:MAG TPA: IS66 family transposase [Vicinamibacterales bacterium]|nr:IS66 family transposase [Vicinamibacterales bacterium]
MEAARRAGARQAAPFSKGAPKRRPRRPGRKPGRAYGRRGQRPIPTVVHETHTVPLPRTCPACGDPVRETHVAAQYQEDLPPVHPVIRRFEVHVGRCRGCQRRVQGRHPLQTSDALGAAAVQLGPHAIALAVSLNKQFGLSFGKIATVFQTRFALHVTPSALVRALHRAAAQSKPTYAALCETVRTSRVVVPDETGWKVRGLLHWLWVFATATTTVYCIRRGRGFRDAASVLGADFAGGLGRDGWAPYRQFREAFHQTCVGHLLRRCRTLQHDHPRARFPARIARILQHALAVRDRRAAGIMSAHGVDVARGHLFNQVLDSLEEPGTIQEVQRFARHLTVELPALFSFLVDPTLDATNWRAEQALRPAVITRKVCGGGNRSARGAETQQVLASLLRTAHQRGLDSSDVLTTLLRAPAPIVSPHFYPTSASLN